ETGERCDPNESGPTHSIAVRAVHPKPKRRRSTRAHLVFLSALHRSHTNAFSSQQHKGHTYSQPHLHTYAHLGLHLISRSTQASNFERRGPTVADKNRAKRE